MRLTSHLRDVLEPVRDIHVAAMLQMMAHALDRGGDVEAEPIDRDADGSIRRRPPLDLPARRDLRVTRQGRTLLLRTPASATLRFTPFTCGLSDVAAARIAPFGWGRVSIVARAVAGAPNWTPVRRWFLESFQPRFGEESPDLLGVAHSIAGPVEAAEGWRFTVDLGSASVAAFEAMIAAFGETGCAEIAVGETETAA